jgi:hypothetical protein
MEALSLFTVVTSGEPQQANKYYLQMGRRSRGGRTKVLHGEVGGRGPISKMMGRLAWRKRA